MTFDDFAKAYLLRLASSLVIPWLSPAKDLRIFPCIWSFLPAGTGMPRAACPVKSEAYLTRMRGEHHFVI